MDFKGICNGTVVTCRPNLQCFCNIDTHISDVVESSDTVDKPPDCGSAHDGDSYLLFQSPSYKVATEICLTENVVIPARMELVLEGKLVKTTSADVGMITANRARAYITSLAFTFRVL